MGRITTSGLACGQHNLAVGAVFSVGVDDLERPEAQVGATAPACDARPQAVQSVPEIPEDEPISSYTDDEDPGVT